MEKTLLIHSRVRVYYYYQFVYKLVYYNNKTNSANSAMTATGLNTCRQTNSVCHDLANTVSQDLP